MPTLIYDGVRYERLHEETVLEALLRQGASLPFSCRRGSCQVCLLRAVDGAVADAPHSAVSADLRARGYFLACQGRPQGDLTVERAKVEDLFARAVVVSKDWLAPAVCRLRLDAGAYFTYQPGQFVNLRRPDGMTRSYSLASLPADYFLELHVKRMWQGEFSNWLVDELAPGDDVELSGPHGEAVYATRSLDQPMLLIGTGTGLAPLLGIARGALAAGHRGPIEIYHGSRDRRGLYLQGELHALAARHANVRCVCCTSAEAAVGGTLRGRADEAAFLDHPDLAGWRVHLAGLADMVRVGTVRARLAGALAEDVVADPFDRREAPREAIGGPATVRVEDHADSDDPPPVPELWALLDGGDRLSAILTDFYDRVYEDPRLAPFFRGVTKERAIQKQFSFLRQVLTGEQLFLGDRPKNAHHWMVISDELFDYRETLFAECALRAGIPASWCLRWRALHEHFRADIVKSAPIAKRRGLDELPVDGFGEEIMSVGTICDACGRAIDVGERVRYHLRLGETFCSDCAGWTAAPPVLAEVSCAPPGA